MSKVKLVKAESKHTQFIYDLHRDHQVMRMHGIHEAHDPPFWRNVISGVYPGWDVNFVITRGAVYLGYIGLQDYSKSDRRSSFMITVMPSVWKQGIGTAAMQDFMDFAMNPAGEGGLGIECLWSGVFEENMASQKLLRKLGFQNQGLIPNYFRIGNKRFARIMFAKAI